MSEQFGVIEEKLNHGLFGATFTWILEILPYLKNNNIYPDWQLDTHCYGPIFPSVLKVKKINQDSPNKLTLTKLKTKYAYIYKATDFKYANQLFFEYFDISDEVLQSVNNIHTQFGLKTLGIHFRGTDKLNTEADFITIETVIKNIKGFLEKNKSYDTIFVASDEEIFITTMKANFSNVIYSQSFRSTTKKPVHKTGCDINLAKMALVDSLLLSKCNFVIKTSSCLSDWVKIWNPDIEVYNLNRFREKWFPQAMIPLKSFIIK